LLPAIADVLERALVQLQRSVQGGGDRLAREVVGRRPQAAGHDDAVGSRERELERLADRLGVVRHRAVPGHDHARFLERAREEDEVRVERAAGEDLVADGDDLDAHGRPGRAWEVRATRLCRTAEGRGKVRPGYALLGATTIAVSSSARGVPPRCSVLAADP